MKITDLEKEIKKKIVADRQKDYGDYQYNFTILAELFTLILAPNLKKKLRPYQVGQIMMTLKLFRTTKGYKADNYHDLSIYESVCRWCTFSFWAIRRSLRQRFRTVLRCFCCFSF